MSDTTKVPVMAASWADEEEEYEEGYDPNAVVEEPEIELPMATPMRGNLSRQNSSLSRQSSQGSVTGSSKPVPNDPPYKAFVGNLPFRMKDHDLNNFFPGIKDVVLMTNDEGRPNGRAIIEFHTRDNLIAALEQNQQYFMERALKVDVASRSHGSHGPSFSRSNSSVQYDRPAAGASQDERSYHQRGEQRDHREQQRGGQRQWNDARASGDRAEQNDRGFSGDRSNRGERPQTYDRERRDNGYERGSHQNDRRDTRDNRYEKPQRQYSAPRRDSDAERERPAPLTREISSTSSTGGDIPAGATTPAGRPKLMLAPRTVAAPTAAVAATQDTKGIFGGARPRDVIETSTTAATDSPVASPAHATQTETAPAPVSAPVAVPAPVAQTKTETTPSPSNTVRLVEGPLTSLDAPADVIKSHNNDRRPNHQQRGGRTQQPAGRTNDRTVTQPQQSAEDSEWQRGSKANTRGPRTIGRGGTAATTAPKKAETEDMSKPTNAFAALSMDDD